MKTSIACPKCNGQITLWHGLQAPTPFRIRCARCKTKLRVKLRGLKIAFVGIIIVAVPLGGYLGYLIATRHWAGAALLGVALVLGWFFLELLTGLLLFTRAEFTPID